MGGGQGYDGGRVPHSPPYRVTLHPSYLLFISLKDIMSKVCTASAASPLVQNNIFSYLLSLEMDLKKMLSLILGK